MALDVIHGDCLAVLPTLGARFHAVVTDPPYGLEFMGVAWDTFGDRPKGRARPRNEWGDFGSREHARNNASEVARINRNKNRAFEEFSHEWARAVYDVMLPGGYLVAFASTRGYHRMVCAIEDAGFIIHPMLGWIFGSGFPKATNLSKMIDKQAGAEREVIGKSARHNSRRFGEGAGDADYGTFAGGIPDITAPATPEAQHWDGWAYGLQSLKPALEPICLAQRPVERGGMVANVLTHGCGALNIDSSRVPTDEVAEIGKPSWGGPMKRLSVTPGQEGKLVPRTEPHNLGRWPANVIHDGSAEVEAAFAVFGTDRGAFAPVRGTEPSTGKFGRHAGPFHADTGTASRFFYSAKADAADRADSRHPTVKPVDLMRYLVRLVTPPGGRVLDPFAGSGTTGEACMLLGFDCTLIERDEQHYRDILHRQKRWSGEDLPLFQEAAQ